MDVTGRGRRGDRGSYIEVDPRTGGVHLGVGGRYHARFPARVVEVTLTPDGDGTLVRLIHRGVAPENQQHSAAGWATIWTGLPGR